MGEGDHARGTVRDGQVTSQVHTRGWNHDVLVRPVGFGPRRWYRRAWHRLRLLGGRPCEQGHDLAVGDLGEVGVPLAYGEHHVRRVQADDFVGDGAQLLDRLVGSDRDRQHDASRAVAPGNLACGTCGGPGGDAVIDHDHRAAAQRDRGPLATKTGDPALQFGTLGGLHSCDLLGGDVRHAHHVVVENPHVLLADGAHGQFRLERHSELAHHDHVQRRVQRSRDLEGHRHATARQSDAARAAGCLGPRAFDSFRVPPRPNGTGSCRSGLPGRSWLRHRRAILWVLGKPTVPASFGRPYLSLPGFAGPRAPGFAGPM